MVRWLICTLCFVTACASTSQGPASTAPGVSQQGDHAVVDRLFELTARREQYTALLRDRLTELQRIKPQQANVLREFFRRYLSWEAVEGELTEIYLNTYSARELADMVVFFGTPAGKKLSAFQPTFLNEVSRIAVQRVQDNAGELFKMGIISALGQEPEKKSRQRKAKSKPAPMTSHRKAVERVLRGAKFATGYQAGLQAQLDERQGGDPERTALLREFYTRYLGWDAIKDEIARLYMDAFTEEELGSIATFYESSTGERVVQTEAALGEKMKTIMVDRFTAHADDLFTLWRTESQKRSVAPVHEL